MIRFYKVTDYTNHSMQHAHVSVVSKKNDIVSEFN